MTVLDQAHAGIDRGEAEGLAFYRALADAELLMVLEEEARGEVIRPRVFDLSDGPMLLVFDSEERLGGFGTGPVPYAALPGRVIAAQMVGQGLSLGLNLGTGAASAMLLPPDALDWLIEMLDQRPAEQVQAQITRFEAPKVPEAVLNGLAGVMRSGGGGLAGVVYASGRRGIMLALTGVPPDEEPRVARAVTEALAFSGLEASELDLTFVAADDPVLLRMAEVGLMFQPQVRVQPKAEPPKAPGSDPLRPPILR
ncbi:MAG: SseB family protein [Candidatus Saccharibacteria bacterium]|nr:SseB family protein [Pseudorhodobacter sp.]